MKSLALYLVGSLGIVACSSSPDTGSPLGGGGAATGGGGQTAASAGAAGTLGNATAGTSAGGSATAGAGGSGGSGVSGSVGSAGSAGTGGSAGGGASGTAGGGSAGGGASGTAGGGPPVDPGNLPNQVPAGYTGTPFGGKPQTIPGKIEIEKYDLGGAGVAFQADAAGPFNKCGFMRTDGLKLQCTQQQGSPQDKTAPGCGVEPADQVYIGYIGAGNWYKYTVNVVEAGTYVISGHEGVAGNTQMQFGFTDAVKTAPLTLPSTNVCNNYEAYHVWAVHDKLGEITLTPGKYVLTITVVAAAMNLDWFAFTKK
jgi:hypothetical protein